MNFSVVTFSSIFTTRELRRYRTLFRSRDLTKTRNSVNYNKRDKEVNALFYISMGPLSPNNRAILRKEFSQRVLNGKVKITLLPTSLSQYLAYTSYLSTVNALLKGSSFQFLITFSIPSDVTTSDQLRMYLKSERNAVFSNLNTIMASYQDSSPFTFNPIFITLPTLNGSSTPRRYSPIKQYYNIPISYTNILADSVSLIKKPSYALCTNLQSSSKNLISVLAYVQKTILFHILFRVDIKKNAI